MADSKVVYTLSQVAQHRKKQDCWVVINGRVLNVTEFLETHPGGDDVLLEVAGKDATKEFQDVGHSKEATALLGKYQVGILQGASGLDDARATAAEEAVNRTTKDMPAFVIKEEGWRAALPGFLELAVPLTAAATFFGYTYLNRVAS
uniref:Cytochrome b5 heme-binding domain-containing protein n=1 Tax=Kalanchoe fedtschenkoi TaxID=63787 RepID=A0A7N0UVN9_KALFE